MLSTTLAGLFFASLLAATLLPTASEVLFWQLLINQPDQWLWFWLAASLGNSVGGAITYCMGVGIHRLGSTWNLAKRLNINPPTPVTLVRIEKLGIWILLLSWLPLVGDLLCLAAGILQWSKWKAILLISIGKFARYGLLAWWLLGF